jgi:thiol-disulfide isomerase/thioredoxin
MSRGFVGSLVAVLAAWMIVFHLVIKKPPDERYVNAVGEFRDTSEMWIGAYPPDFELELLDGGTFRLSDVVGSKMVILNFFATWCGPCSAEIPELRRFANEHEADVLLLGIDVKESPADVRDFVLKRGVTYSVAIDREGRTAALYEAAALPTTVVVGVDGRVWLHDSGAISNADIAFGGLLTSQHQLLATTPPISGEDFRMASETAGHPTGKVPEEATAPVLDGRALELAARIRCPSCGRSLLDCDGKVARGLREHLARLDVDNMSDAQVLKALFLLPEADR